MTAENPRRVLFRFERELELKAETGEPKTEKPETEN